MAVYGPPTSIGRFPTLFGLLCGPKKTNTLIAVVVALAVAAAIAVSVPIATAPA